MALRLDQLLRLYPSRYSTVGLAISRACVRGWRRARPWPEARSLTEAFLSKTCRRCDGDSECLDQSPSRTQRGGNSALKEDASGFVDTQIGNKATDRYMRKFTCCMKDAQRCR